jgi:methylmalonyl-CoA/ethylmalonyl-CoA epimerase
VRARLHHIGLAVPDPEPVREVLAALGLDQTTPFVDDPIQRVAASFVDLGTEADVHLEFLRPSAKNSPIDAFLAKTGGGLHHICLEVDDLSRAREVLSRRGLEPVSPEAPCQGMDQTFGDRAAGPARIAFWLVNGRLLIELLERRGE